MFIFLIKIEVMRYVYAYANRNEWKISWISDNWQWRDTKKQTLTQVNKNIYDFTAPWVNMLLKL